MLDNIYKNIRNNKTLIISIFLVINKYLIVFIINLITTEFYIYLLNSILIPIKWVLNNIIFLLICHNIQINMKHLFCDIIKLLNSEYQKILDKVIKKVIKRVILNKYSYDKLSNCTRVALKKICDKS